MNGPYCSCIMTKLVTLEDIYNERKSTPHRTDTEYAAPYSLNKIENSADAYDVGMTVDFEIAVVELFHTVHLVPRNVDPHESEQTPSAPLHDLGCEYRYKRIGCGMWYISQYSIENSSQIALVSVVCNIFNVYLTIVHHGITVTQWFLAQTVHCLSHPVYACLGAEGVNFEYLL
ncbi:hypothetical protein C0J52_10705 [Blattella germanica]|nr:hypothetical protein C0J52_10705 [Blattella germanica]